LPINSDEIIKILKGFGVRYFKIMGSGGAGSIVFFKHNDNIKLDEIRKTLPYLTEVNLENQGSRIIHRNEDFKFK
jgi:galactokinase/mevalonate kinase-like predicted kinase